MAQQGTPRFVALTCAVAVLAGVLKLGRVPGTLDLAATQRESSAITLPGLDVFRPEEGLFFANATSLRDEVLKRVPDAKVPVREVLLDMELTDDLDVPGADILAGCTRTCRTGASRCHWPGCMRRRCGCWSARACWRWWDGRMSIRTCVEAWMACTWCARAWTKRALLHGEERHREYLLIRLDEADTRMRELLRSLPHPPADDDSRGPVH
ncbi:hypothetical protein D7Y21_22965 [Corallococcus sp. AB045]|nr:hypothetical protein D7Y21_22965 [Corallococcus sp. AB045]